jgi:hypothetical protein
MTSQTDEADARAPALHRRGMRGVEWSLFYQFKAFSHHHRVYVSSFLIIIESMCRARSSFTAS